ncbi:MAG TPA: alpha-L-fucosidase [Acidobacteriaceae bacterium]|nr:alpha-L-fucosidase [Acidobacteriaceae bacterium]
MKRRELLKTFPALAVVAFEESQRLHAAGISGRGSEERCSGRAVARPTPQQIAWQNLELGMFIHFAPNTWQNREYDDLSTPLSSIDPKELNTDQWADTAVSLGARYVVFVAKHAGGFCMWQTKTTDYGIAKTPWKGGKGDVVAEIAASCHRRGLKFGIYCSPTDRHFGAGIGGRCKTPDMQARYNVIYREQLTELFTRYGELIEIWFDGSTVTPVADLIHRYQPNAMVFQGPAATIRWVGNEDGYAPYPCWNGIDASLARLGTATALDGDPNGSVWLPNEVDVSIRRPDWFWSTTNASLVLTPDQLLSIYYRSVGRGAQLLLNIPPNREGLMDGKDCRSAEAFGEEIRRRFGTPLAATRGSGRTIRLDFRQPQSIDTVILEEDTGLGERVRAFRLEGRIHGAWIAIGRGTAIGHKRIQPVERRVIDAVRLRVREAAAPPRIRTFAVFDTGQQPPADWDEAAELWAPNLAGRWSGGKFSLGLGKSITAAAQYSLTFIPAAGKVQGFDHVSLLIGGVASPEFIHASRTKMDELLLDITALNPSIIVSGTVLGAERGEITLDRR